MGEGDRAMEYYHSICPSKKEEQIETYRSEPYVYAQMTAGKDASCFGEAKNSWLTGTAAWTFVVVSQGIYGIKPSFQGLEIDPCIPKAWPGFSATRKFRGATYQIEVKNPKGICKGAKKLTVDGKDVPLTNGKAIIPIAPKGTSPKVVIELG